MPKMKTNRLAAKKFKVGGKGTVTHARARTSHNTGHKSAKRMRQLKGKMRLHATAVGAIARQLPYAGVSK
jgi:large subunit ribosomal protein L35